MCVKGAEFRVAKTGPRKGTLSIMVKGTERSVCLTREEIAAAGADNTV
jgi:Fe2+ transport system protein FeoA